MEPQDKMFEFIRRRLSKGDALVPEDSWTSLSKKLGDAGMYTKPVPSKNNFTRNNLYSAFFSGVALAAIIFYLFWPFGDSKSIGIANTKDSNQRIEGGNVISLPSPAFETITSSDNARKKDKRIDYSNKPLDLPLIASEERQSDEISLSPDEYKSYQDYLRHKNMFKKYLAATKAGTAPNDDHTIQSKFLVSNFEFDGLGRSNDGAKSKLERITKTFSTASYSNGNTLGLSNNAGNIVFIRDTIIVTSDNASVADTSRKKAVAKSDTVRETKVIEKKKQLAKTKSNNKILSPGLSFDLLAGPEMSGRAIDYSNSVNESIISSKKNDKSKVGFSISGAVNVDFTKSFYMRTGLSYLRFNESNMSNFGRVQTDTGGIGGSKNHDTTIVKKVYDPKEDRWDVYTTTTTTTTTYRDVKQSITNLSGNYRNSYSYVGVPIIFGGNFYLQKFKIGIFSGLVSNILVSPKKVNFYSYLDEEGKNIKIEEKELNRINLMYTGGIELYYSFSDRLSFKIAPTAKYSLNSIYANEKNVNMKPYSYGLQFGVQYIFKKPFR